MNQQTLSKWLANLKEALDRSNPSNSCNLVQGWPVPFFGDVLHARVLTVGVNPSDKEFRLARQWDAVTNPEQWQSRLLTYFQNSEVPPWIWFETWSICLTLLELGYAGGGAAHIDVSPRPTTPMLDKDTNKVEFRTMVEHDAKWFFELLAKLPQVQLLLVAGPIPRADGSKQQLADFIRERAEAHGAEWKRTEPLPRLITPSRPDGIPVFICPFEPGVDGLYAMVRHVHPNRDLLIRLSAPPMNSVPLIPARLDWSSAIGNFMLNFGTLEYFVFVFLKDRLPQDEFDKVKEWHLKNRLVRIEQCLRDENRSVEEQTVFADLVRRLEPLRELRNHIAHGHIYWRRDEKSQSPSVTLFKAKDLDTAYLPGAKHVEFLELEDALEALPKLIEEFQLLAGFKEVARNGIAGDLP